MSAILFREDFDRFPSAIVHTSTKNKSWVELASKYKQMGIKNYYFHLALINPILADYDPRDPNLPEDVAALMMVECSINPWYALREVISVPPSEPGKYEPIQANRGNIAAYWCMYAQIIVYLQQIRQTGKSLWGRTLVTDFHHFRNKNSQHILYTKSDLRSQEIAEYKRFRMALPSWAYVHDSKEADNQIAFTTLSRDNETKTYIPSGDPEGAKKVGRGTTPDLILNDETPFCSYCPESVSSLAAAVTASFPKAKANGKFHGIAYTTTAGDLSTREGKFVYHNIKKKSAAFGEFMYDFSNIHDLHGFIEKTTGEVEPKVDITFNHNQLGYTDEWLKQVISRNPGTRADIMRDHLNLWTYGSTTNPIPEHILNLIKKSLATPKLEKSEKYDLYFKLYRPMEYILTRQMVAGIDTSNATGKDNITIVGIDVETTETLVVATINNTNLIFFANFLAELLELFPKLTLVPEDKFNWKTIQDQLLIVLPTKGIDPGRRIYSRIVDNFDGTDQQQRLYREYSAGYPSEKKYRLYRDRFGFPTDGPLRQTLFDKILKDSTRYSHSTVRDSELIDELSTLVEKNNRIDHAAGGNDDHVLAWLIANWFLRSARNLNHYGIDVNIVLGNIKDAEEPEDRTTIRERFKKNKLKNEIESLTALMEDSTSQMEIRYYESRIKSLKMDLGESDSMDNQSIDKRRLEARNVSSEKSPRSKGHYSEWTRSMRTGIFGK